jgi:hypothetical protein
MKRYGKSSRIYTVTLFSLILLMASASCVLADKDIDFDEVEFDLDDDNLDIGESLVLQIEFQDPDFDDDDVTSATVEMDLRVEIDGIEVHYEEEFEVSFKEGEDKTIEIDSDDFRNEDDEDVWDGLLMAYDCGSHDVMVELSDGDLLDDYSLDQDYEIDGDSFDSVSISMQTPSLEEELEISVTDEDGDEYEDKANIRIVWLSDRGDKNGWDEDDEEYTKTTKSDGTRSVILEDEFGDDAYGAYRLDVYDNDPEYCLHTIFFNVSNKLTISDTTPASPKVGVPFTVKITKPDGKAAVGVSVMASGPGGFIPPKRTGIEGTVSFTFSSDGSYTLSVGGDGTYDLVTKTITISEKPLMSVTVSPETQESGKPVEITVKSDGKPLSDATITVVPAGKTPVTLQDKTSTEGKVTYTPAEPGDYTVKAVKSGYTDGTETFKVQDKFKVELPAAEDLGKGSQVIVKVRDQKDKPVEGASVSVEGKPVVGITDANGLFKFTITEVGVHTIVVSKTGFSTSKTKLTVGDELKIVLSVSEVELDGKITVTVTDSTGMAVEANIKVTKPDGTTTTKTTSTYTYTTEKVGEHSVEASKESYSKASAKFTVNPRAVTVSAVFEGDKLVVKANSRSKPVSDLNVVVTPPTGKKTTVKTDKTGKASMTAVDPGNYKIEVDSVEYVKASKVVLKESPLLSGILIPVIIVLVVITLLVIIAILLIHMSKGKRGGKLKPKKGSSLGG